MLTVGDKEVENSTITLRTRDNVVHSEITLSKFESFYFFDAKFWSISIPIVNGAVELNPFDCLNKMPDNIKGEDP